MGMEDGDLLGAEVDDWHGFPGSGADDMTTKTVSPKDIGRDADRGDRQSPERQSTDADTPDSGLESRLGIFRLAEWAQTRPGCQLDVIEPSDRVSERASSRSLGDHSGRRTRSEMRDING